MTRLTSAVAQSLRSGFRQSDTDYLHGDWLEDFVELVRPLFCPDCPAVPP